RRDVASAFVIRADWARYGQVNATARASDRFAELIGAPREADATTSALPQRLVAASPPERLPILTEHLRRLAASVIGAEHSMLNDEASLASIGVDSLMAFELKVK